MNDAAAASVKPLAFTPKADGAMPSPAPSSQFSLPPLLGSQSFDEDLEQSFRALQASNSLTAPDSGLTDSVSLPSTPTSPSTNTSSSDARAKKTNPLNDLIDTEKSYVEQLTGIIRKVAAAWSRSNLPPTELDTMFRCIESVYKANRSLLLKLKEIGKNPSSPKALGDLLMRWIDDLESPYTNYTAKYCCGFDDWEPVQSNKKLPGILEMFSTSSPTPAHEDPTWTLDTLFLLPKGRLKYYRKLYSRLLRSTTPGKSDHRLLVGATEKLDKLLATLEERQDVHVGQPQRSSTMETIQATPVLSLGEDELVAEGRLSSVPPPPPEKPLPEPVMKEAEQQPDNRSSDIPSSSASSMRDSSVSGGERLSRETANTSVSRGSATTMSMPISELERRLSTTRTLDIFTMQPRTVKLQMSPPQLTYTRELRCSIDCNVSLVPRATGQEVVYPRAHVFLLSDLFLFCERMTQDEQSTSEGADMWLLFPPLAGKVLRITEESDDTLHIAIMRKETLVFRFESVQARNTLKRELLECIEFASSVGPMSKQLPPPVPSLSSAVPSIASMNSSPVTSPRSSNLNSPPASAAASMYSIPSPDPRFATPSPAPSAGSQSTGNFGGYPGQMAPGQSFKPGGIIPPQGPSFQPGRLMSPPPAQPGQIMQPQPGQIMHPPQPGQIMQSRPGMTRNPSSQSNHYPATHPHNGQVTRSTSAGPHSHSQGSPARAPYPPAGSYPGGPGPDERGMPPRGPPQRQMTAPSGGPMPGDPRDPNSRDRFSPQQQGMYPPQHQQQQPRPFGSGPLSAPMRPPSNPSAGPGPGFPPNSSSQSLMNAMRKSPSTPSLHSQYQDFGPPPPMPGQQPGYQSASMGRRPSAGALSSSNSLQPSGSLQPLMPSAHFNTRGVPSPASFADPSPPGSPVEESAPLPSGPVTTQVVAQMKCKVFLKQQHAQWKSLGSSKLMLYRQDPTNIKQLVVEADDKHKTVLISTIVLTDGVERVGKTGVAIELSDKGMRTGVVYMIQLRNEKSAGGLFDELLKGSDRAARMQ